MCGRAGERGSALRSTACSSRGSGAQIRAPTWWLTTVQRTPVPGNPATPIAGLCGCYAHGAQIWYTSRQNTHCIKGNNNNDNHNNNNNTTTRVASLSAYTALLGHISVRYAFRKQPSFSFPVSPFILTAHLLVLSLGKDDLIPRIVCLQWTDRKELWIHEHLVCGQDPGHLLRQTGKFTGCRKRWSVLSTVQGPRAPQSTEVHVS